MIALLPYIFYCFLIGFHQIILKNITSISGVEINLPVIIVLLVAIYKDEIVSIWFGFFAGIVLTVSAPEQMAWQGLFLSALSYLVFHLKERMNLESVYSRTSLIACGVLLHNMFSLLLLQSDSFWSLLVSFALPGTVYSALIGSIYFLGKDGKLSINKLKEIF